MRMKCHRCRDGDWIGEPFRLTNSMTKNPSADGVSIVSAIATENACESTGNAITGNPGLATEDVDRGETRFYTKREPRPSSYHHVITSVTCSRV